MTCLRNFYSAIFVMLVFSMNLSGMQMNSSVRIMRAQELVTKITNNKTLTPDYAVLSYLHDRVKNHSLQGEERILEIAMTLSSNYVYSAHIARQRCDFLVNNTKLRTMFYFARMVEQNISFKVHERLGYSFQASTEYEQPYTGQFKKVTLEEFREQFDATLTPENLQEMFLDESKQLAEDALMLLQQTSSNRE